MSARKKRQPRLFPPREQREYDWAFAHHGQLAKRYPDQWVAFAHRRVLAAGSSLKRVLDQAHRKVDWPEIPHLFVEAGVHFYAHRP